MKTPLENEQGPNTKEKVNGVVVPILCTCQTLSAVLLSLQQSFPNQAPWYPQRQGCKGCKALMTMC